MINFSACHRTVTFGKKGDTPHREVRGKDGRPSGSHDDGIYATDGQGWTKAEVPQKAVKKSQFSANA